MAASFHCIRLTVINEDLDCCQGALYERGCLGLIEEAATAAHTELKAYFPDEGSLARRLEDIAGLSGVAQVDGVILQLTADMFRSLPFEPFELAESIWVVPPPEMAPGPVPEDALVLVICPGMAFGTGRHESTQLVATTLKQVPKPVRSLLDVGTGSGILAILARRLGMDHVDAVEISEDARDNARGNFALNQQGDIQLFAVLDEVKRRYAVVVANILTPTLIHLKADLIERVQPGGGLILAGITLEEGPQIEAAFAEFTLQGRSEKNGWLCYYYSCGAKKSGPIGVLM